MHPAQQRKILNVERGLFVVRYATAEDESAPPTIRLLPQAASRDTLRFVLHPDESEPALYNPGGCLVMRAEAPGRLAIDIQATHQRGSVAATVRIEPLLSTSPMVSAPSGWREPAADFNPSLQIVGHVASRGDVSVPADAWLAGPTAPARIEGFKIDWPGKPDDLEVRYAVKTGSAKGDFSRMTGLGTFVGSRGRSSPILGLVLETAGAAASRYQIAADMIFLGAPVQRIRGARIQGSGPTGREPLVGLRLSVEQRQQSVERRLGESRPSAPRPPERVRIFRSNLADRSPIA